MPVIVSIQVGQPQTYGDPSATDAEQQQWRTAFFKSPCAGPVAVSRLGLAGDGQADLRCHGGPDKAVLAYSAEHYPVWQERLQLPSLGSGGFGENLTVAGLDEEGVCIGDIWILGEVILQVSQPRQPCWKLGRRWQVPELPKLTARAGWTGWYFRVLAEGTLASGMACELQARPHADWPVARANQALFDKHFPAREGYDLAALPELAESWKADLLDRLRVRGV